MYEIYCQLRDAKGCKDAEVSRCTGVAKSTLSDWKAGKSNPKQDKLASLAKYFEVSVEYLMTGEEPKTGFTSQSAHLVAKLRQDTELTKALEKYFNLSDEKKKHVIDTINMLSEEK